MSVLDTIIATLTPEVVPLITKIVKAIAINKDPKDAALRALAEATRIKGFDEALRARSKKQAETALVANGFTAVARGEWKPPVNMAAAKLRELGFQIVEGVWVPPPVKPNPPEVRYVALLDTLELLVRECRKNLALDK